MQIERLGRVVCHFSCGAASAVACKLAIAEYKNVVIYNAYIKEEHEDNRRFLKECEEWFGQEIVVLKNEKYNGSAREVWRRGRFIKSRFGAPCSKNLKREVLNALLEPNDLNILGYTKGEEHRFNRFIDANNGIKARAILIDKGLSKEDCLAMIDRAGIKLPYMYRIGFNNANCIGCCKGGQNYWKKIRKHFPNDFNEVVQIQNQIGPSAYFLAHTSGPRKGERMSLTDLPDGDGNMADEPSFSCSLFCEMAESELNNNE